MSAFIAEIHLIMYLNQLKLNTMKTKLINPTSKEVEMYTMEDYDDMLDECYPEFMGYLPSDILQSVDPTAYRCGFNDYQEYKTVYVCPCCHLEYDDFDDAKYCCQVDDEL